MLLVLVDDEFSLQNPLSLKSDLSWAYWYISEYQCDLELTDQSLKH